MQNLRENNWKSIENCIFFWAFFLIRFSRKLHRNLCDGSAQFVFFCFKWFSVNLTKITSCRDSDTFDIFTRKLDRISCCLCEVRVCNEHKKYESTITSMGRCNNRGKLHMSKDSSVSLTNRKWDRCLQVHQWVQNQIPPCLMFSCFFFKSAHGLVKRSTRPLAYFQRLAKSDERFTLLKRSTQSWHRYRWTLYHRPGFVGFAITCRDANTKASVRNYSRTSFFFLRKNKRFFFKFNQISTLIDVKNNTRQFW